MNKKSTSSCGKWIGMDLILILIFFYNLFTILNRRMTTELLYSYEEKQNRVYHHFGKLLCDFRGIGVS